MTTKITEQNISNLANAGVQWQSVVTADGSTTTTLVAGRGYFIDTTSAAHTVILPTSPNVGDIIQIRDYAGTFGTNNLTVDRNGHNLGGSAVNGSISSNNTFTTYVYVDSTQGWLTLEAEAKSNPLQGLFTEATGGTVTTSGDYKIHTFTGDGCFAVTQIGNNPATPTGGPDTVSYVVVAGGGSSGGCGGNGAGGGGAGGFREGRDIGPSYTASPLVAPTGLTITATTYPITVGAGGAADPGRSAGSPSSFSTITSAGGGAGSSSSFNTDIDGGSGGGGRQDFAPATGGSGNTPPVSPPQGNPGGNGQPQPGAGRGGGGGGAGGSGSNYSGTAAGPGGNGVTSSITGSSVARAGGGGGAAEAGPTGPGGPGGTGGSGGGGNGVNDAGCNGSANTGGGGGADRGSGGKGIVIIRYKYQ
jgi:hypothetical protein